MKINDYYLRELNSLRHMGEEFSHKNPGLAPYLAKEGQDPDVERMLEGFAFLTGRLKQQLDEELPEVSHTLTQILWPNYVRPIPSYSIIAYEPLRDQTISQKVPKGTEVYSESTGTAPQCRFQTCYDTFVHPIEISQSRYFIYGSKGEIEIDFSLTYNGTLATNRMDTLTLFINGTRIVAEELYVYMLEFVDSISLDILDFNDEPLHSVPIPNNSLQPVGFSVNESVLPYPDNVFKGHILLQEYFAFVQKHHFIRINNLNMLQKIDDKLLTQSRKFRLRLGLSRRLNIVQSLNKENFLLYATPIINLFEADAIPIRKTPFEDEYLLSPSEFERNDSEVFAVESVRGWIPGKNSYEDFMPFESFNYHKSDEYYSLRIKLSDDGERTQSYIRFASAEGLYEKSEYAQATVSVKLLATNRSLPSKLRLGQICVGDPHSASAHLKFKNITIPTLSYSPPIGDDFLWRMVSNMSLNYLSLNHIETLRSMISSYDFPGMNDSRIKNKNLLMLKGITSIRFETGEMIYEGFPIRGILAFIDLDINKFTGIGEAYLFCNVLNEFLALYGTLNSFHRLEAKIGEFGTFYWTPRLGQKQLI